MKQTYVNNEIIRISSRYDRAKHAPSFENRRELSTWYGQQLDHQDCKCHYCETSIFDINRLIDAGLLATRAVRGEGVRGRVLEIDKEINELGYSPENCVLACYYCNNDKSYIFSSEDYKRFYGPGRKAHFSHLMGQLIMR